MDRRLDELGFPIVAIIRVAAPEEKCARLKALVQGLAEVLECHHVTGSDAYVLRVVASSTKHLESVIEAIARHGGTPATSVVFSSPVSRGASSALRGRRSRSVDSSPRRAVNGASVKTSSRRRSVMDRAGAVFVESSAGGTTPWTRSASLFHS